MFCGAKEIKSYTFSTLIISLIREERNRVCKFSISEVFEGAFSKARTIAEIASSETGGELRLPHRIMRVQE